MSNLLYPVSACCLSDYYLDYFGTTELNPEPIKTCCQCGNPCEIIEGDENETSLDRELEKGDNYNKSLKENSI